MKLFVNGDGGLTTAGYAGAAVLIFLILIVISAIGGRGKKISARILACSAAAIALAFVCSFIAIFHMPMGGSVTLFSMLFITLIGYWYGPAIGIMGGVAYGLLQLIQDPYIVSLPQMVVDYLFAFGALGLSGFFSGSRHGLMKGYLAGVIGRFVFSVLSGVIFFADYAPKGMNPFVYSVSYNGAYLAAEAAITVIVLLVPAVSRALANVKNLAAADR